MHQESPKGRDSMPVEAENPLLGKRKRSSPQLSDYSSVPAHSEEAYSVIDLQDRTVVSQHGITEKKVRLDKPVDRIENPIHGREKDNAHANGYHNLPLELWQYIFTFVSPQDLGTLLSVARPFSDLLNPEKTLPDRLGKGFARQLVPQNNVWQASRQKFYPGMPRPMSGLTEVQMWRLIKGRKCQFCGHGPPHVPIDKPQSEWENGPGSDGVRIILPFQVRSCGRCLGSKMIRDTDLLLSTSSALLSCLPFAFFTSVRHYVPIEVLQSSSHPRQVQISKYYYRPYVEELERKAEEVRSHGSAAMEEWYKGLEWKGKERLAETSKWEQWLSVHHKSLLAPKSSCTEQEAPESQSQFTDTSYQDMLQPPFHKLPQPPPSTVNSVDAGPETRKNSSTLQNSFSPKAYMDGLERTHQVETNLVSSNTCRANTPDVVMPRMPKIPPAPGQEIRMDSATSGSTGARSPFGSAGNMTPKAPSGTQRMRTTRSAKEVAQLKAERKLEIERRCREMDPPIHYSLLVRLPAFGAAIQIAMPMDDNTWEVLKPRLLAEAKNVSTDGLSHSYFVDTASPQPDGVFAGQCKPRTNDQMESLPLRMQMPSRDRITSYASQYIQNVWNDGSTVTRTSTRRFAVDVLMHVYARFHEDQSAEDEALRAQGLPIRQETSGPRSRRLTLEDMKHIFEENIKPFTDIFLKDLFLCSVCDITGKHYPLEGLIQHYAAKHTSAMSHGSAVVYWKADWPADPPFNPNPGDAAPSRQFHTSFPSSPLHSYTDTTSVTSFGRKMTSSRSDVSMQQYSSSDYNTDSSHMAGPWKRTDGLNSDHGSRSAITPWQNQRLGPTSSHIFPAAPSGMYHSQRDELIYHLQRTFELVQHVHDIPNSILAYVLIHHSIAQFRLRYSNTPSSSLFLDALRTTALRPLKVIDSLYCKPCVSRSYGSERRYPSIQTYNILDILEHFQQEHLTSGGGYKLPTHPALDWRKDMVELPGDDTIRRLRLAPGMNGHVLTLVAEAFPLLILLSPTSSESHLPASQTFNHITPVSNPRQQPLLQYRSANDIDEFHRGSDLTREPIMRNAFGRPYPNRDYTQLHTSETNWQNPNHRDRFAAEPGHPVGYDTVEANDSRQTEGRLASGSGGFPRFRSHESYPQYGNSYESRRSFELLDFPGNVDSRQNPGNGNLPVTTGLAGSTQHLGLSPSSHRQFDREATSNVGSANIIEPQADETKRFLDGMASALDNQNKTDYERNPLPYRPYGSNTDPYHITTNSAHPEVRTLVANDHPIGALSMDGERQLNARMQQFSPQMEGIERSGRSYPRPIEEIEPPPFRDTGDREASDAMRFHQNNSPIRWVRTYAPVEDDDFSTRPPPRPVYYLIEGESTRELPGSHLGAMKDRFETAGPSRRYVMQREGSRYDGQYSNIRDGDVRDSYYRK